MNTLNQVESLEAGCCISGLDNQEARMQAAGGESKGRDVQGPPHVVLRRLS